MKRYGVPCFLALLLIAAPLALSGCGGGGSGKRGATGLPGEDGLPASEVFLIAAEDPEALEIEVEGVTIASPPVVRFTVMDPSGRGGVGLGDSLRSNGTEMNWARFSIAKLVPGANGEPNDWVNYLDSGGGTYERLASGLDDHGDGSYTYTFDMDLAAYDGVPYEPNLTHRLTIQSSGGSWASLNVIFDFVPAQGAGPYAFPATRDIVTTDACNECHDALTLHGSRFDTRYCVMCHNPGLGESSMTYMVHALHAGTKEDPEDRYDENHTMRENDYVIESRGREYNFGAIIFPQDLRNCRKCHKGTDGDNWKNRPTQEACGACHDGVNFSTHYGGQNDNAGCALVCHTPAAIERTHLTENATPHNPDLPEGLVNIEYEIAGVTVDGSYTPVVKFRVLGDGEPIEFDEYDPDDKIMIPGFTDRAPSFLVAWAVPQAGDDDDDDFKPFNGDDDDDPLYDYNNLGHDEAEAGQPQSVGLDDVWNGSEGDLYGPDENGYYEAWLNFVYLPPNAQLRAVALQGYFEQVTPAGNVGRHAKSVFAKIGEDELRRPIVDDEKCAACHEWFEGHGGNRTYTIQVCAFCHVPNLSSSGRSVDLSSYTYHAPGHEDRGPTDDTIDAVGWDPLQWPEDTNNLKDMIHGIHAAHDRTTDFEFVRDSGRRGVFYYNFSHVHFPQESTARCLTCHLEGTYRPESIPMGALPTTTRTTTGNPGETQEDVQDAREDVPNPHDLVNTAISSACFYCHDTEEAAAHMEQNGGVIGWMRELVYIEQPLSSCIVCHGEGKIADVEAVHSGDDED